MAHYEESDFSSERVFTAADFKQSYIPVGPKFIESEHVTEYVEDWSACRSPSRARRREKYGHRQHVKRYRKPACYRVGNEFHIHPELMRQMKASIGKRIDRDIEERMRNAIFPGLGSII